MSGSPVEKRQRKNQPTVRPTEYRCNIREGIHYGQRVRKLHRGQSPSSAVQLPIMAALHAGLPTLFSSIIHQKQKKVNMFLLIDP